MRSIEETAETTEDLTDVRGALSLLSEVGASPDSEV